MNPAELPLRIIPKRAPHPLRSLVVTATALLVAFGIRLVALGSEPDQGLTSTLFPAFIVITLYAGATWGFGAVAATVAVVWAAAYRASDGNLGAMHWWGIALYLSSALVTVAVCAALREVVLRLEELSRAQADAEAHRQESEARFRILADSAAALMWVTRPDRKREFVNRAYVEFLGRPFEEALEFDWRDRIHKDDIAQVLEDQVKGESSLAPFSLEARYLRADGEWRWLRSISRPRIGPHGEFEGFIGIAFDVTDAKQVEEDLKRINDLLAEKVEEALEERDQAQAALMQSQKLEAVGQLTGGVAHDFNNLLTVVIGALDIIMRHPHDEPRRKRLGEAALAAARRGERLTQQLLAFSRRQPLRPEVVSVDDLLQDAEPLLRRAAGETGELAFDLGAPGVLAQIDAGQFEAAILNLLLNARDATKEDGRILVETRPITLTSKRGDLPAGDYVVAAVADNGPGMSPETIARCFEPFFTTKPVGKGTGLGLSQVYGFARQSGGAVEIESAPGEGARVKLYLPATQVPASEARPVKPHTEGDVAYRVLLVEDDIEVGDLVEAMLGELGHKVVRAANADEALDVIARRQPVDVILTDVIMPGGKSGIDLAREVTATQPGLPVILSSGYIGETLEGAEAAPWPLLRKPYTLEMLTAAIREAVETVSARA